jgi:hypothetical protein
MVAAKLEDLGKGFVFFLGSINRSPLTAILSFFVENLETVFDWGWLSNLELVFKGFSESPLQSVEVEVNSTEDVFVIWINYVISIAQAFAFKPLSIFEISLGDVLFPPSFDYAD